MRYCYPISRSGFLDAQLGNPELEPSGEGYMDMYIYYVLQHYQARSYYIQWDEVGWMEELLLEN